MTRENMADWTGGVSLGNYLNIRLNNQIAGDFEDWVKNDPLFMHEYGHRFDSRLFGPLYLFGIGLPSATGAEWTEIRANRFGARYFASNYGVDWAPFEFKFPRRKR